jgi:hypothetical protein
MHPGDLAAIAIVLACCSLMLQRLASERWKRRFGAIGSPLIKPPAYRALFVLVLIGILIISTLPEAALVLPAIDVVGLDIVTILVALELRHYLASACRLAGFPTGVPVYFRMLIQVVSRRAGLLRTNPTLWLYACMWLVIWHHTLMGRMKLPPAA